jgi:hypothetical protein
MTRRWRGQQFYHFRAIMRTTFEDTTSRLRFYSVPAGATAISPPTAAYEPASNRRIFSFCLFSWRINFAVLLALLGSRMASRLLGSQKGYIYRGVRATQLGLREEGFQRGDFESLLVLYMERAVPLAQDSRRLFGRKTAGIGIYLPRLVREKQFWSAYSG